MAVAQDPTSSAIVADHHSPLRCRWPLRERNRRTGRPSSNRTDHASVSGIRSSAPSGVSHVIVIASPTTAGGVVLSSAVTRPLLRDNPPHTWQRLATQVWTSHTPSQPTPGRDTRGFEVRSPPPADRDAIEAMSGRCSLESRFKHFHAGVPRLLARYLDAARAGPPHEHDALIAVSSQTGAVVALAGAAPTREPLTIEVGTLVEDAWRRLDVEALSWDGGEVSLLCRLPAPWSPPRRAADPVREPRRRAEPGSAARGLARCRPRAR